MKLSVVFGLVLLSGLFAFCNQASNEAIQNSTEWVPATINGIVLGRSKYDDIIKLWGEPYHEAEFAGDSVEPEEGGPTLESLTELHYRNIEIDGERVNAGVLIGNETRLVKVISYNIEEFTKDAAIRKFGLDYYLVITRESTCIEKSQKRNQDRKLEWSDYPVNLVYPQKGMIIQVRKDNTVMMVNYADKCK